MLKQPQPRGFPIFFLTEMWERYGFYVLQSLLVFYGLEKLHLSDAQTYAMVGSFTALAYINSFFGGLIADRFLGCDNSIMSGAVLLCIGYTLLTISSHVDMFVLGLATVTVGTGMLKPNISSMLSILYKNDPAKKEIGYTLFYVGIYFGAIGGSFIGGFIRNYFGWIAVFGSAACGLAIAFITFYYGKIKFKLYDQRGISHTGKDIFKAIMAIFSITAVAFFGIKNSSLALSLFTIIGIFSVFYVAKNIAAHHGAERKKLIAFSFLTLFSVLYWAVYFQQFFSISLCTARVTQLTLPESSLTAFESLGVILFGPIINAIWLWQQKYNKGLSIAAKFSLSFLLNSISFLILILSLEYAISQHILLNQVFIIISYFTIAIGELFISPIGLAMVSTLAPERLNGAMMGIFLMSLGFGGKLAGLLAETAVNLNAHASIIQLQILYRNAFTIYFGFSIIVFIFCLIAIKPINKLVRGN